MSRTLGSLMMALPLLLNMGCASSSGKTVSLTPQQERGRRAFQATCVACHDPNSQKPRQGPGLAGLFKRQSLPISGAPANDERVREVIQLGRPNMPGFRNLFDDDQLNDLLAYLHTL